jgi:hypothetical protein
MEALAGRGERRVCLVRREAGGDQGSDEGLELEVGSLPDPPRRRSELELEHVEELAGDAVLRRDTDHRENQELGELRAVRQASDPIEHKHAGRMDELAAAEGGDEARELLGREAPPRADLGEHGLGLRRLGARVGHELVTERG